MRGMRRVAIALLLLAGAASAAERPSLPPSVLRSGVDAERLIRPPPEPLSVMREPPGASAVVEELARHGAAPAPRPLRLAPPVDLRASPPSAAAIVEALRPE
jgi:hypothetical protein